MVSLTLTPTQKQKQKQKQRRTSTPTPVATSPTPTPAATCENDICHSISGRLQISGTAVSGTYCADTSALRTAIANRMGNTFCGSTLSQRACTANDVYILGCVVEAGNVAKVAYGVSGDGGGNAAALTGIGDVAALGAASNLTVTTEEAAHVGKVDKSSNKQICTVPSGNGFLPSNGATVGTCNSSSLFFGGSSCSPTCASGTSLSRSAKCSDTGVFEAAVCTSCQAGYKLVGNQCVQCPTGYSSLSNSTTCNLCLAGYGMNSTGHCNQCASPKYNDVVSNGACATKNCPKGQGFTWYYPTHADCHDCPSGQFSDSDTTGQCQQHAVCNISQYEYLAPNASNDRVCRNRPKITLVGGEHEFLSACNYTCGGGTYHDAGATCKDVSSSNSSDYTVDVSGETVQIGILGNYTIKYDCKDKYGGSAVQVNRIVTVQDVTEPVITSRHDNWICTRSDGHGQTFTTTTKQYLINEDGLWQPVTCVAKAIITQVGTPYTDFGVTCADDFRDEQRNSDRVTVSVNPSINLTMTTPAAHESYPLNERLQQAEFTPTNPGTYTITYNCDDQSGNKAPSQNHTLYVVCPSGTFEDDGVCKPCNSHSHQTLETFSRTMNATSCTAHTVCTDLPWSTGGVVEFGNATHDTWCQPKPTQLVPLSYASQYAAVRPYDNSSNSTERHEVRPYFDPTYSNYVQDVERHQEVSYNYVDRGAKCLIPAGDIPTQPAPGGAWFDDGLYSFNTDVKVSVKIRNSDEEWETRSTCSYNVSTQEAKCDATEKSGLGFNVAKSVFAVHYQCRGLLSSKIVEVVDTQPPVLKFYDEANRHNETSYVLLDGITKILSNRTEIFFASPFYQHYTPRNARCCDNGFSNCEKWAIDGMETSLTQDINVSASPGSPFPLKGNATSNYSMQYGNCHDRSYNEQLTAHGAGSTTYSDPEFRYVKVEVKAATTESRRLQCQYVANQYANKCSRTCGDTSSSNSMIDMSERVERSTDFSGVSFLNKGVFTMSCDEAAITYHSECSAFSSDRLCQNPKTFVGKTKLNGVPPNVCDNTTSLRKAIASTFPKGTCGQVNALCQADDLTDLLCAFTSPSSSSSSSRRMLSTTGNVDYAYSVQSDATNETDLISAMTNETAIADAVNDQPEYDNVQVEENSTTTHVTTTNGYSGSIMCNVTDGFVPAARGASAGTCTDADQFLGGQSCSPACENGAILTQNASCDALGVYRPAICTQKQCTCDNGEQAVGVPCNSHGEADCASCDAGSYLDNDAGGSGVHLCVACRAGTMQSVSSNSGGVSSCQSCPEGTFQPSTRSVGCLPCSDNQYTDQVGQNACKTQPSLSLLNCSHIDGEFPTKLPSKTTQRACVTDPSCGDLDFHYTEPGMQCNKQCARLHTKSTSPCYLTREKFRQNPPNGPGCSGSCRRRRTITVARI